MLGKGALIYVIGFGIVLATIGRTLNQYALDSIDNVVSYHDQAESHTMAITGANVGMSKVYQDSTWFGTYGQPIKDASGAQTGNVKISRFVVASDTSGTTSKLQAISAFCPWYAISANDTIRDTVEVTLRTGVLMPYSTMAWMTNDEGNVWWMSQDTVFGRVHSNSALNMDGTPTFYGRVTTAASMNPMPGKTSGGHTNKGVFKGGYETGVPAIPLPQDLSALTDYAQNPLKYPGYKGNWYGNKDLWVTLDPGSTSVDGDGKALVWQTSSGGSASGKPDTVQLGNSQWVLATSGTVHVQGTLDGKLTLVAGGSGADIKIENDVKYQQNPFVNIKPDNPVDGYTGNDFLGLVANDDIIVRDNSANDNGCTIMGALLAVNGSFTAENYDHGSPRNDLTVVGSITQNTRGAVGTFSGGVVQTGYAKQYYYDTRFDNPSNTPPGFPGFNLGMVISDWWESYPQPKSFW